MSETAIDLIIAERPMAQRDTLPSLSQQGSYDGRGANDAAPQGGDAYVRLLDQLEEAQREIHRLRQLIHVDELCGIGNRRAFNREMERACALAERYGMSCHLALIDVDAFKAINDRHGHAAGDFVLASLAVLLKGQIRHADALCRLGGDEFAIVFINMGEADVALKVAALKRLVAARPIPFGDRPIAVSVSIGTATVAGDATEAYRLADRAMYADKARR